MLKLTRVSRRKEAAGTRAVHPVFQNEAGPTESGFAWKSAKIPQDAGPGEKGAIARNWLNRKEQDLARAAAAREYGLQAAPAKANRGLRGF